MCMNYCEISINNAKCISNIMVFNEKLHGKIMKEYKKDFKIFGEL